MVARGVNPAVFHTIDSGKGRSLTDVFNLEGRTCARDLASALRILFVYRRSGGNSLSDGNVQATRGELEDLLKAEPGIEASITPGTRVGKVLRARALWVFAHYIFGRIDREEADIFFECLCDGTNLKDNDPIRHFRDYLIRSLAQRRRLSSADIFLRAIQTWNATRERRTWNKIATQKPDEGFPAIV